MIGKMITDHDRDLIIQDFDKVILSSRKMWADLALPSTSNIV